MFQKGDIFQKIWYLIDVSWISNGKEKYMKKKAVISLDAEVYDRFKQLSFERHLPMASLVTQWIMDSKVSYEHRWNDPTIDDFIGSGQQHKGGK